MAMNLTDRILTIVATATITSAVWIVAGGSLIELADSNSQRASTRPADAAPSPQVVGQPAPEAMPADEETTVAVSLDTQNASEIESSEARELIIPVLNVRSSDLTDTFSDERGASSRLHEAIDIMAPDGTSVVAAAPGTIEKLFVSDAGGNTIFVRTTDRKSIHYYAHLGEYAEGLKEGQRVRRGQRLGTVGSTGNASPEAPHLHFAIMRTTQDAAWWEPSNAVNPYPLLTEKR